MKTIRKLCLFAVPFVIAGCTLTEWGEIAKDTVKEAPPILTDPTTWSAGPWGIAGGVVALVATIYRKSLARNFGRAVNAVKRVF